MCRTTATAPCGRQFIRASFRLKGVVAVPRRGVSTDACVQDCGPTHLQLGRPRKHLLETDTDTLDDGEQDSTANGTVPRRLVPASDGQRAAREETGNLRRVRPRTIGLWVWVTCNRVVSVTHGVSKISCGGWGKLGSTYASSFFLTPLTAQSNVLNMPPQTPKLPPSTGARILMAVMAPNRRSP